MDTYENVGSHTRFMNSPSGLDVREAGVEIRTSTALNPRTNQPYRRRGAGSDAYIPSWAHSLLRVAQILALSRDDRVLLLRRGVEEPEWAALYMKTVDAALDLDPFNFLPIRRFLTAALEQIAA